MERIVKKKGLLAFDLGTSGVKCSVYDTDANLLNAAYGEYETVYPHADWREQEPSIWIDRIIKACHVLRKTLLEFEICGIGVSGHSLGVLPIDENGELLTKRVPIWSDARAKTQAKAFFEKVDRRTWYEQTGNGFPAELYSLFKIMWYRDNTPEIYQKTAKFIGTKDYINLYLTGVAVTDVSYASGSGLYSLKEGTYIKEYAKAAEIDIKKLPKIYPSSAIIGRVTAKAAKELGIAEGIPVVAGGVDNACMALGAGCFEDGDTYASLGSSAWITVSASEPVVDYEKMIYTFAHCIPGKFIPSIGIFASGSALAWAADNFFPDIVGNDRFDEIGALAKKSCAGANGLLFNPCLSGGSSSDKSPNIRGGVFNLSLKHTRADLAHAVFDGIAMHLCASAEPLNKYLGKRLLLVGGGAKGAFSRQIYADVFGKEVVVSRVKQDAASLGAAVLAAVGCGLWHSFDPLKEIHKDLTVCRPNMYNYSVYEKLFPFYKKLCDACSDLGDGLADLELYNSFY